MVECTDDPETAALGLRLLEGIRYRGVASVEFKRDERDGVLKLMEISPRYPLSNALGPACGIDLPLIDYLHLTGQPLPAAAPPRVGVRWIDVAGDLRFLGRYRREDGTKLRDLLREYRAPRVHAAFARDDPLPLLFELLAAPRLARRGR